ncbi:alpha/beta-hydrolase [Aspergillus californicus]
MPRNRVKYSSFTSDVEGYTRVKHLYIPMRDGVELCADLFLPFSVSKDGKKAPVIFSLGPYGKDIHASMFGLPRTPIYAEMYKDIKPLGPDAVFELCEPTIWCREYGYAILRVDSRGVGGSQGKLDPFGLERTSSIQADAERQGVRMGAVQSWCTGKVACSGISYYGMVGYWVAMQKPPHLTCVLSYESNCNIYQSVRRGGIYSNNFQSHWYNNIVLPSQAGKQDGSLSEEELECNRVDYPKLLASTEYPNQGIWATFDQVRRLSDIEVPFYLAGNWTDPELHMPGNIRGFNEISSKHKWLEMHTGNHLSAFYESDHIELQRKFLDCFLFDKNDNGMLDVPPLRLLQHHGTDTFYHENETAFPPPDAEDVAFYLTEDKKISTRLSREKRVAFKYPGYSSEDGNLQFSLESAFTEPFEVLGSPYLELEVSTKAKDMDLFIYLRAVDTGGNIIVLHGNHGEAMDSFARGYFRLSHRDEVGQNFAKEKILNQANIPRSDVVAEDVYKVLVPLYPAGFLFDEGQSLTLEIGAVNTPSTIPPMRHEGGDRTAERFSG